MSAARPREWPTFAALVLCYGAWGTALFGLAGTSLPFAIVVAALAIATHASLQHEAIHGHPFDDARWNAALVFPALGLLIPYVRFRDTHLDHHLNADLTDPYDDPESQYLDPAVWHRLPWAVQRLLLVNNTLLGRILLGTLLSQVSFVLGDLRRVREGDARVLRGWLWHIPALALVLLAVSASAMPLWAYAIAAYAGLSLIKIRTFLEHQAHDRSAARTVIIEDRGPLAYLFLNNNLHLVHHAHPNVPWHQLPALYDGDRQRYRAMNDNYVYPSYSAIARRHLLRRKDPVPHPLWPSD